jgi:hypothetical protein
VHIGLQSPIHLPHTKTEVLEIIMIDLWFDMDEIHTPSDALPSPGVNPLEGSPKR